MNERGKIWPKKVFLCLCEKVIGLKYSYPTDRKTLPHCLLGRGGGSLIRGCGSRGVIPFPNPNT